MAEDRILINRPKPELLTVDELYALKGNQKKNRIDQVQLIEDALKAQREKDIKFFEALGCYRDLVQHYETVIIPQKVKEANKQLIEKILSSYIRNQQPTCSVCIHFTRCHSAIFGIECLWWQQLKKRGM
jgi:hypothetical protein